MQDIAEYLKSIGDTALGSGTVDCKVGIESRGTSPQAPWDIEIGGRGYVTPERLAAILGCSTRTLLRWHVLRRGPPRIKIGKTILYAVDDIPDWLSTHREGAAPRNRRGRR